MIKTSAIRKTSELTPFQVFLFNQIWLRGSEYIKADYVGEFPDIRFESEEIEEDLKDIESTQFDTVWWEFFVDFETHTISGTKEEVISIYFQMSKSKAIDFYNSIKEYLAYRLNAVEKVIVYKDLVELLNQINFTWYYGNNEFWG